jgi:hypothetical protein
VTGPVLATTVERGGSAGFVALLIVVLLFLATVLLIRNMSSRLKRLPKEFPPPPERDRGPRDGVGPL